jgi:hypothetical protein
MTAPFSLVLLTAFLLFRLDGNRVLAIGEPAFTPRTHGIECYALFR